MSTGARKVTPESYAPPAVVLTGMKSKAGCVRQTVEEVISVFFPPPPDIFGDNHSFVVVLAWRGLSYLFLLFLSWGKIEGESSLAYSLTVD